MSQRLVLLGPPASGKGTQGRRLAERLGLSYLSTGALLRSAVEEGSPLGREAAPILARHEYLPDPLMCSIMGDWLESHAGGWVLDGFPRSPAQAEYLSGWLAARGLSLDAAILLEVPESELLRRIRDRVECPGCRWSGRSDQLAAGSCPRCGGPAGPREDDTEDGFRSRLAEYLEHTLPVVDRYEAAGLLRRFDAASDPAGAEARLLELIRNPHGPSA
jgi:adenylate kinase